MVAGPNAFCDGLEARPPDRTIKRQQETRGERDWFNNATTIKRRVVTPRWVEYHIAELDALDESDYF